MQPAKAAAVKQALARISHTAAPREGTARTGCGPRQCEKCGLAPPWRAIAALSLASAAAFAQAQQHDPLPANEPVLLTSGGLGDPQQGALVYDDVQREYVLIGGSRSTDSQAYDVVSFNLNERVWKNVFPFDKIGKWGPEIGAAALPEFPSPWWGLVDVSNFPRPSFRRKGFSLNAFQWTHVKASNRVFFLFGNHTIAYDIAKRTWKYYTLPVNPAGAPFALGRVGVTTQRLMWSSLVADASSSKLLLFGGTNTSPQNNGDIGTWIFDIEKERWRQIEGTAPPRRAYSQMVTDADRNKVLLFGGDALDALRADTWTFDFATEKWTQLHPAHRPSPRFGHAMVFLPKSRQIILWAGWEYNPGYAFDVDDPPYRYKRPLELWHWDWKNSDWRLIRAMPTDSALNKVHGTFADPTAASEADELLFYRYRDPYNTAATSQTWALRVDTSVEDAPGTKAHGATQSALLHRAGRYDPAWFAATPAPTKAERTAHLAVIKDAPGNTWIPINTPNRPKTRQDWGTVAIDAERQTIYRWSGGHASYSGNDVLEYDIQNNRFSSSHRPEVPLEWIASSPGTPGDVSFKGRPFLSAHSYKMYTYAPAFGKLAVVKPPYTYFYDPQLRQFEPNPIAFDFNDVRDNVMVAATRDGLMAWAQSGVFALDDVAKGWRKIAAPFSDQGTPHRDSSTLVYDSTRNRMLLIPAGPVSPGQVWQLNPAGGAVKELHPHGLAGMREAFPSPEFDAKRMFRDAVYVPDQHVVLLPKMIASKGGTFSLPLYDAAENRWYAYDLQPAGAAALFMRDTGSANTSMVYDSVNKRVWALDNMARIWVLKLDKAAASKTALR